MLTHSPWWTLIGFFGIQAVILALSQRARGRLSLVEAVRRAAIAGFGFYFIFWSISFWMKAPSRLYFVQHLHVAFGASIVVGLVGATLFGGVACLICLARQYLGRAGDKAAP